MALADALAGAVGAVLATDAAEVVELVAVFAGEYDVATGTARRTTARFLLRAVVERSGRGRRGDTQQADVTLYIRPQDAPVDVHAVDLMVVGGKEYRVQSVEPYRVGGTDVLYKIAGAK